MEEIDIDLSVQRHSLDIAPAKPKIYLEVDQSGPALVDEFYRLILTVYCVYSSYT